MPWNNLNRLTMLLSFLAFLSGCVMEGKMPPSAPAPAGLQSCTDDSQCILVDISCNGCCGRDAVNRKDSAAYYNHKAKTCVGNLESVCDCCYFESKAVCAEGRCAVQVIDRSCK